MQIGTGFLGWTEQETLDTSIPTIELAFEGRVEMLRMQAGIGPAGAQPPPEPEIIQPAPVETTMAMFRAIAGGPKK